MSGRKKVVLVIASAAVALVLGRILAPLERRIDDVRASWRPDAGWPPDLALVRIAEGWPWPPERLAALLEAIENAGAKTIAIDALLVDARDDGAAERVAASLDRAVLAVPWIATRASLRAEDAALLDPALVPVEASGRRFAAAGFVVPPARYASAALALGHAIAEPDGDGLVRRTRPLAAVAGTKGALPSAPFAAWLHHRGVDPHDVLATAAGLRLPDGSRVPSPVELDLAGAPPRSMAADEIGDLRGALAVVCVDERDVLRTPLGEKKGCDLFASAIRTFEKRSWPRRLPAVPAVLALAALMLAIRRTSFFIAIAAGWLAGTIALAPIADLHLPVIAPLLFLGLYFGSKQGGGSYIAPRRGSSQASVTPAL